MASCFWSKGNGKSLYTLKGKTMSRKLNLQTPTHVTLQVKHWTIQHSLKEFVENISIFRLKMCWRKILIVTQQCLIRKNLRYLSSSHGNPFELHCLNVLFFLKNIRERTRREAFQSHICLERAKAWRNRFKENIKRGENRTGRWCNGNISRHNKHSWKHFFYRWMFES